MYVTLNLISDLASQEHFCKQYCAWSLFQISYRHKCRIPCHLFACHWLRITSIVFWLVLQRRPLNANNSGKVFCTYAILPLDTLIENDCKYRIKYKWFKPFSYLPFDVVNHNSRSVKFEKLPLLLLENPKKSEQRTISLAAVRLIFNMDSPTPWWRLPFS